MEITSPRIQSCSSSRATARGQFLLEIHQLLNLRQKPAVDPGQIEYFIDREAGSKGMADEENPLRVGHAQLAADDVSGQHLAVTVDIVADAPRFAVATQATAADLKRTQTFLKALLECAPDGHGFTHALHLRGQRRVGLRKLLESE